MYMRSAVASAVAAIATLATGMALAQSPPAPPTFETTKVDGTDNVYVFRYMNHQAMFVVTPAGVIATDPISYGRPQAAKAYVEEIQKVTKAPIKYLIYSHHHYDHIAGGKLFKDAGAVVIAHKRAKERLAALKGLDVVIPDEAVDNKRTIKLGGTTLELHYVGRNHSDSSLVMFLPKEKLIFAVDFNSLGAVPSRLAVNDSYPIEWEASLKTHAGAEVGPHDPGPSRTRRAARNPRGHGAAARVHDRSLRRGEEGLRRRQMLLAGRHGAEAAQVHHAAGLRAEPRLERPPLVRLLGPRHLNRAAAAVSH